MTIFERRSGEFVSLGVGLTLPVSLIDKINALADDKPCPYYWLSKRFFYRKNVPDNQSTATEIWRQPLSAATVNWGMLYETLRYGLDDIYHAGCEVINIEHGP